MNDYMFHREHAIDSGIPMKVIENHHGLYKVVRNWDQQIDDLNAALQVGIYADCLARRPTPK